MKPVTLVLVAMPLAACPGQRDLPVQEAMLDIQGKRPSDRFKASNELRTWLTHEDWILDGNCRVTAVSEEELFAVLTCKEGRSARFVFNIANGRSRYDSARVLYLQHVFYLFGSNKGCEAYTSPGSPTAVAPCDAP